MDDTGRRGPRAARFPLVRRAALFVLLFACMQLSWQALRDTRVERFVVDDLTVRSAVFLVDALTPSVQAKAVGASLKAPGGGINVLNGCEGMEGIFLLLAAFAVAPLTRVSRIKGALFGVVMVYGINQARILVLFYAYRASREMFDPLHSTVTPIAVVLLIAGYFYVWLVRAGPAASGTA